MSTYIAWFKDLTKDSLAVAGGKGANLGEMYRLSIPVPNGFCVTAQTYQEYLEKTQLKEKIAELLEDLDVEETEKLQATAAKVQELIVATPIPEDVAEEIMLNYELLGAKKGANALVNPEEVFVAVRSSATAEDLPSVSEEEHILVTIDDQPYYRKMKELAWIDPERQKVMIPAMERNSLVWKQVSGFYKHLAKGDKLYKIKTVTGREVTISPNHSLIVLDEETLQPKVIHAEELKGKEKVPVISHLPEINSPTTEIDVLKYVSGNDVIEKDGKIFIKNKSSNWTIQHPLQRKISYSEDFAYFLGIYLAEGSTYKNNQVLVTNANVKVQSRTIHFLKQLCIYSSQKINKHTIRVYCKALVKFLHATCGEPISTQGKGKLCGTKRIPDFAFGWRKEFRRALLRGLFDGDGGVENSGIGYSSTSPLLIGGIIKLLEMENICFTLYQRKGKISKWKDCQRILVPSRDAKKFLNTIGFEDQKKLALLRQFVTQEEHKKHFTQLHSLKISPQLSLTLKKEYENTLPKKKVKVALCPSCNEEIEKTSFYKTKLRFYCRTCHKAYYHQQVNSQISECYQYYDEKGHFKAGAHPWNKGLLQGRFSYQQFSERMEKLGLEERSKFFESNLLWDTIKKVEEIPYSGYVYDFTVPEVENFAAGVGGIITHNSASFAGQQATFLNVRGKEKVVAAVLACWASLFTARAIYYRVKNGFDHMKVFISAVVQKMVNADKSGIMFTVNPATNHADEIVIEAVYGLGEMIVGGEVNPDMYLVNKQTREIEKIEVRKKIKGLFRNELGQNQKEDIAPELQQRQVLDEKQIKELARLGKKLEEHYGKPQDIEWAIEKGEIFIVQTRAVTTFKEHAEERSQGKEEAGKILLKGETASAGVYSGIVKIVHDPSELNKIQKGDVLVTAMTTPDMVPAMQRAGAIITNEGGMTCIEGKARVFTNKGFIQLKDIGDFLARGEELKTISVDAKTKKVVWRSILCSLKRRAKTFEIAPYLHPTNKLEDTVKITPDHKMPVLSGNKLSSLQLKELVEKKQNLLVIDNLPQLEKNIDLGIFDKHKLMYLCGSMFSDGHIVKRKSGKPMRVMFSQKNTPEKQPYISTVLSYFHDLFNAELKDYTAPGIMVSYQGSVWERAGSFECSQAYPAQMLQNLKDNFVQVISCIEEEFVYSFLAGIIDGDGHFNQQKSCLEICVNKNQISIVDCIVIACLRLNSYPDVRQGGENFIVIKVKDNVGKITEKCQRVKAVESVLEDRKLFDPKVFQSLQLPDWRGNLYSYYQKNIFIGANWLTRYLTGRCEEEKVSQIRELANSDLRMQRMMVVGETKVIDVYNLTIEAPTEEDHNFIVFTKNYTPLFVFNCHAAIVSREMGTPCIVGTEHATDLLVDGEIVTVHATRGIVYEGKVAIQPEVQPQRGTVSASGEEPITATEIKTIVDLPGRAEVAAASGADGVGLVRLEIMIAEGGVHLAEYIRTGREQEYVKLLKEGIGKIARAFKGKTVWVRCSDMRSDEYRNLKGGDKEPKETDPMIGWHAIRRLLDEPEILKAEFQALRELHYEGVKNVGVMLPFVIRVDEVQKAKEIMRQVGLEPCKAIDFGIMVETPAACWIIEDLCKEGISFVSFGTNDLTQLTLGIDRNNERLAKLFDEMHPAVLGEIAKVIKVCKKYGVKTSICGQAGSRQEMAEFLVHQGIDSISANVDAVSAIRHLVARVERKVLLERR